MPESPADDFDPQWYLETYPDVALSGLDPLQHFQRFGRLMGRAGSDGRRKIGGSGSKTYLARSNGHASAHPSPRPRSPGPIIDRPDGFDPEPALPDLRGWTNDGYSHPPLTPDSASHQLNASAADTTGARAPLKIYSRMFSPDRGATPYADPEGLSCGGDAFRRGDARIENAWLAGEARLRLMLAGGERTAGWRMSAYQAVPSQPDALHPAGEVLVFPAEGPIFHDFTMLHPLMPVVMELSDENGDLRSMALLPFPSLLPGGLHGVELKAVQSAPNPMDGFWTLSDMLLEEHIGQPGWADPSIGSVSVHLDGATGAERIFSDEVREWLAAVFGLVVHAAPAVSEPTLGEAALRLSLAQSPANLHTCRRESRGIGLMLPRDGIPTIAALVSRQIDGDAPMRTGPFLVAEEGSLRPRWSAFLPPDVGASSAVPTLLGVEPASEPATHVPVTTHLAVVFRPPALPPAARFLLPHAPDAPPRLANSGTPSFSVILDASSPKHARALCERLRSAGAARFRVRAGGDDATAVGRAFDRLLGPGGWERIPVGAHLRDLARSDNHPFMLTAHDSVTPLDPETISFLAGLLADDPSAASASCLLIGERIVKKQAVLEPAAGGVFPAQVSFATSPRLAFTEPDVYQAFPALTYPVVANSFLFTLWRRSALADLPIGRGPIPPSALDIRVGLDLMEAGYRNLCTSKVRAGLGGNIVRRDAIDPIGGAYIQASRWEDILNRVATLRELF